MSREENQTQWRLLVTPDQPAVMNMAIDEAVLEHVAKGLVPPTIRFYSWSPPAVSLGYFQSLETVVDTAACERLGIEIVRRMTGGGAVLHDREITYSVIVPVAAPQIPRRIVDCYRVICRGLIDALGTLGIEASFVPPNDILVDGRKISGSAMTERQYTILQHGTLLQAVDVGTMFTVLRVDPNARAAIAATVRKKLVGLDELLGHTHLDLKQVDQKKVDADDGCEPVPISPPSFDQLASRLASAFAVALGVDLVDGDLVPTERDRATVLSETKYGAQPWRAKYP